MDQDNRNTTVSARPFNRAGDTVSVYDLVIEKTVTHPDLPQKESRGLDPGYPAAILCANRRAASNPTR